MVSKSNMNLFIVEPSLIVEPYYAKNAYDNLRKKINIISNLSL